MKLFEKLDTALVFSKACETVRIEPWGKNSLRIRATRNGFVRDDLPHALQEKIEPPKGVAIVIDGEVSGTIINGTLEARVNQKGLITFLSNGKQILTELPIADMCERLDARTYSHLAGSSYRVSSSFAPHADEHIYGMGQHRHGKLDVKGCTIDLVQRNTMVTIPFYYSSLGYGFLWNNPAIGHVEFSENHTRWVADSSQQIDYWVTAGDTPAQVMVNYVDVTGHSPMLPEFASGFWQCKLRYSSQEELLSVAREHTRRGLPMSVIVIDYFHWTAQGDWKFDPEFWPDPQAMVDELKSMGIELMVSIWPSVTVHSENFDEMEQRGFLLRSNKGFSVHGRFVDSSHSGPEHLYFYDTTNPQAREYVWEKLRKNYGQYGIKFFWLDACEPEILHKDYDNLSFYAGSGAETACLYPKTQAQMVFDGLKSQNENDIISLCRSAWAGSQRYGAALWSGDIPSTFASLRNQIPAGLSAAMSGIPWWTTDIGGFIGGDIDSPSFRELIVRWFEYGCFCPLFRLHGARNPCDFFNTGGPNEVWSFGEKAYAILVKYLEMRERLRPYVMQLMKAAHTRGTPPMRPLFYDFSHDDKTWSIADQYMFGPDLLVAPVLHEGAVSRIVYLPEGTSWKDSWSGNIFNGGQTISIEAPLERIPLFLKGDAQLPLHK